MRPEASKSRGSRAAVRDALEGLYARYNDRRYISSDPLEFVYRYERSEDREIAGLVASSLAFGAVPQIRASVARALEVLGNAPAEYCRGASPGALISAFRGFKHRWITGDDMASLLFGAGRASREHGSLGALFTSMLEERDTDAVPATARFVAVLRGKSEGFRACLLPSPESGSACKRLNLFLRWMVRRDAVDPGLWSGVPPSMLLVPLDTHMYRISMRLGLTGRKTADLAAAQEITEGFRALAPEDPVKYDFALTRLGILKGAREEESLAGLCC